MSISDRASKSTSELSPRDPWVVGYSLGLVGLSTVLVVVGIAYFTLQGGHSWNQADWLINSHNVHVRRGLFGSILLVVSDILGVSPLWVVAALQTVLVVLIGSAALQAILRAPEPKLAALVLLSPGFCMLFWVADPSAIVRKEAVTFAAMALLLFTDGRRRRDRRIVAWAIALQLFGALGHSANAVMTPMFLFMAWVALGRPDPDRRLVAGALAMLGWAALNVWYHVSFSGIASAEPVCRPLLERGLSEAFCADAIRVTAASVPGAAYHVSENAVANYQGLWTLYVYAILLGTLGYLITRTDGWRMLRLPLALSLVPILPLYIVGIDWGRHVVMHMTPFVILFALGHLRGIIRTTRRFHTPMVWFLAVLPLCFAPRHMTGVAPGVAPIIVAVALALF